MRLGRFLQAIAMLLLPIGLGYGLFANKVELEVRLLAIGGGLFVVGWLLSKGKIGSGL